MIYPEIDRRRGGGRATERREGKWDIGEGGREVDLR